MISIHVVLHSYDNIVLFYPTFLYYELDLDLFYFGFVLLHYAEIADELDLRQPSSYPPLYGYMAFPRIIRTAVVCESGEFFIGRLLITQPASALSTRILINVRVAGQFCHERAVLAIEYAESTTTDFALV